MKKRKIVIFILICGVLLWLFNSLSKKIKLKRSVDNYLAEIYGIKEGDFKTLSTEHIWGVGVYDISVEIKRPYHVIAQFEVDNDTYEIIEDTFDSDGDGEDDDKLILLDMFRLAYIQQNGAVLKQADEVIKKYNLLSQSSHDPDKKLYYYVTIRMDNEQEKKILAEFKQKLNTNEIIKDLKLNEEESGPFARGFINFNYRYDVKKNAEKAPDIQSIMNDFENGKVLTEGTYGIELIPSDSGEDNYSYAIFHVDAWGKFSLISKEENINAFHYEQHIARGWS
ncbi:hypothetical protein [Bacillus manliponensis]|uniref:hypothetical protein n=1 Tax=Bacillus manliponensis TaxID=574376 RepID=UPI00068A4585|nr:hypothetical protein [Bacillus manliponensis]